MKKLDLIHEFFSLHHIFLTIKLNLMHLLKVASKNTICKREANTNANICGYINKNTNLSIFVLLLLSLHNLSSLIEEVKVLVQVNISSTFIYSIINALLFKNPFI